MKNIKTGHSSRGITVTYNHRIDDLMQCLMDNNIIAIRSQRLPLMVAYVRLVYSKSTGAEVQ